PVPRPRRPPASHPTPATPRAAPACKSCSHCPYVVFSAFSSAIISATGLDDLSKSISSPLILILAMSAFPCRLPPDPFHRREDRRAHPRRGPFRRAGEEPGRDALEPLLRCHPPPFLPRPLREDRVNQAAEVPLPH